MSGEDQRSKTLFSWLFERVDIASLVVFRVVYGAAMLGIAAMFFVHDRIQKDFVEPVHFFSYPGLAWLKPLAGSGMHWLFGGLIVLSILVIVGACYRLAALLLCLGWTYVFLTDQALYQHQYYLFALLGLLMVCMPANRAFSIDVWLRPTRQIDTVPFWPVWLIRAQLDIVLLYNGLARINADWLSGGPVALQLAPHTEMPVIGGLVTDLWLIRAFTYGFIVLDLFLAPLLMWRRTRGIAYFLAVAYHLVIASFFNAGVYPWFMIGALTIFFCPSWPRRSLSLAEVEATQAEKSATGKQRLAVALIGLYVLVQLLVPLRQFLYEGNVSWHRQGERFSWRMRLDHRRLHRPQFTVSVLGHSTRDTASVDSILSRRQYLLMCSHPDLIQRMCHLLREQYGEERGITEVEVRAYTSVSLNGRPPQQLIDPTIDLTSEPLNQRERTWIRPLDYEARSPLAEAR
ncbi:MAG: hypothetical protein CMJ18_18975 [Phycisphaeraceae bacterium]|nr:hypothetical protein [Phycisphaeraceae bacterium]